MNEKELFNTIFYSKDLSRYGVTMKGTMVCLHGEIKFNTDGYNLFYNLYQLTKLLNDIGFFY